MTYATASDLLSRFDPDEIAQRTDMSVPRVVTGALLVQAASGAVLSPTDQQSVAAPMAKIVQALQDAEDTIHGFIMGRYSVPLSNAPQAIVLAECNLARYFLYDENPPDTVTKRYEAAIDLLKSLRDGKSDLGPAGPNPAQDPVGTVMIAQGNKTFRDCELDAYKNTLTGNAFGYTGGNPFGGPV